MCRRTRPRHPVLPRRRMKRLLLKSGKWNLLHYLTKKNAQFVGQLIFKILDLRFYTLLVVFAVFMVDYLVTFGMLWWIVCHNNGDFRAGLPANHIACVDGVTSFKTAVIFAFEVQFTISYTDRRPSIACNNGMGLLVTQHCAALIVSGFVTAVIFAKLTRPGKRNRGVLFSKNALISKINEEMVLLIRVSDRRRQPLINARLRGLFVSNHSTTEGDMLPMFPRNVDFGHATGDDRMLMSFPIIAVHRINSRSPFWTISNAHLTTLPFELIVSLEGQIMKSGVAVRVLTSYLPNEIVWGHNFVSVLEMKGGKWRVNYSKFNQHIPAPYCPILCPRDQARRRGGPLPAQGAVQASHAPPPPPSGDVCCCCTNPPPPDCMHPNHMQMPMPMPMPSYMPIVPYGGCTDYY